MSKNPTETHRDLFGIESRIKIVPLGGMRNSKEYDSIPMG